MILSGLALALTLAAAPPALASGGLDSGGSGGGGGGGGTSGGTPCVQVNSFSVTGDQSVVTTGASLTAGYTVSRCGGNNTSFTIQIDAADGTGAVAWTATDTWFPNKNLAYSGSRQWDGAAFATTYQVKLSVIVPETGALVTSSTKPASTPTAYVAPCAIVSNLNASGGYSPGSTTVGAIWVSYTVQNCGGRDWFDIALTETNQATGNIDWRWDTSPVVSSKSSTGIGLLDNDYAPTSTTYLTAVTVKDHSTGETLASKSVLVSTPAAK
jgi:hypothetical protein